MEGVLTGGPAAPRAPLGPVEPTGPCNETYLHQNILEFNKMYKRPIFTLVKC